LIHQFSSEKATAAPRSSLALTIVKHRDHHKLYGVQVPIAQWNCLTHQYASL
jgi:hypothetical protein